MLWGASLGGLEVRTEGGATRLRATFPYGAETELAPNRREAFAPRAFADRIDAGEDIHLLAGHDWEKPLASRAAGTLSLTDTDAALILDAQIEANTSWARDFIAAHASGLIRGLSPGFVVSAGGEQIQQKGEALLRTVTRAALFELSAVTVPAYPQAQIEARSWDASHGWQHIRTAMHPLKRWRA